MARIPLISPVVTGGVDTHKDVHAAAVVDAGDRVLGTRVFPATPAGYRDLLAWMGTFGPLERVGLEGTGCYGAGLGRYLAAAGIEVCEVIRPDRAARRRRGKNDALDAEMAAHAAHAGVRVAGAKTREGMVEALRMLCATRTSAVRAHREALQVLDAQIIAAPEQVREQLRRLRRVEQVRTAAGWRPDPWQVRGIEGAARAALGHLARRAVHLAEEIAALDEQIAPLVKQLAPSLLQAPGFGIHTTAQLLVTMGDNPQRITSEPRFAKLCGVAPLEASSGKQQRHRLNRGGDRAANSALYIATLTRMRHDERTRAYVERRTAEGKTKPEIIRCLKRYAAREAYYLIKHDHEHAQHTTTPA